MPMYAEDRPIPLVVVLDLHRHLIQVLVTCVIRHILLAINEVYTAVSGVNFDLVIFSTPRRTLPDPILATAAMPWT